MDVLRTILIILIIYYSFRFISRFFVPFLLRFFMKRAQRNFQQKFGQQAYQSKQKEGEVTVDSSSTNKQKKSNSSVGEYVDFEELED